MDSGQNVREASAGACRARVQPTAMRGQFAGIYCTGHSLPSQAQGGRKPALLRQRYLARLGSQEDVVIAEKHVRAARQLALGVQDEPKVDEQGQHAQRRCQAGEDQGGVVGVLAAVVPPAPAQRGGGGGQQRKSPSAVFLCCTAIREASPPCGAGTVHPKPGAEEGQGGSGGSRRDPACSLPSRWRPVGSSAHLRYCRRAAHASLQRGRGSGSGAARQHCWEKGA